MFYFLFENFHQGPEESEESESNPPTEQAVSKSSEVGRVMTEEEYDEWKKEKDGGRRSEEDTGIDWGMGEEKIKVKFLSSPISFICFFLANDIIVPTMRISISNYRYSGFQGFIFKNFC